MTAMSETGSKMMDDAIPVLQDLVKRVLASAEVQEGKTFSPELQDTLSALTQHPEGLAGRQQIASQLKKISSPVGAGFLGVWLGAGVENGVDSNLTTIPVMEALLYWVGTIPTEPDGAAEKEPTVAAEVQQGIVQLSQGLVAHLINSPEWVAELNLRDDIIAELTRVEAFVPGPGWVLELLQKRSGNLVVLHVKTQKGFHVTYQNLSNCFHLFTLLQGALAGRVPGTRSGSASRRVLAVATGEKTAQVSDIAWWHYGVGTVPKVDPGSADWITSTVWGEANPATIPKIDGQQVLLLWPMTMASRSWDAGFFGPFLTAAPPGVTVDAELTAEQVQDWWSKLKLPIPAKPWWKIW